MRRSYGGGAVAPGVEEFGPSPMDASLLRDGRSRGSGSADERVVAEALVRRETAGG